MVFRVAGCRVVAGMDAGQTAGSARRIDQTLQLDGVVSLPAGLRE